MPKFILSNGLNYTEWFFLFRLEYRHPPGISVQHFRLQDLCRRDLHQIPVQDDEIRLLSHLDATDLLFETIRPGCPDRHPPDRFFPAQGIFRLEASRRKALGIYSEYGRQKGLKKTYILYPKIRSPGQPAILFQQLLIGISPLQAIRTQPPPPPPPTPPPTTSLKQHTISPP